MKKIQKLMAITLAIAISAFSMTGCSFTKDKEETRIIVDITGAEVEIPLEVDEVVNLFPFGCQMMIGLDLEEYLVGISQDTFETQWLEMICPESKNIQTYSDVFGL